MNESEIQASFQYWCNIASRQFEGFRVPKLLILRSNERNIHRTNMKPMGRAAGICDIKKNIVMINSTLAQENPVEVKANTIPHEIAHAVVWQMYGRTKQWHGKEFRHIMREFFGITKAETYHDMKTDHLPGVKPRRRQKRHQYTCDCADSKHMIATVTHNRIQRKEREYHCKTCKGDLVFTGRIFDGYEKIS